jgi:hypothetical protein
MRKKQRNFYRDKRRENGEGKAIPLQAWTGPEGSRRLRLTYFRLAHEGGKVISTMHRPPLPLRKYSWYSYQLEAESISGS